MDFETLNALRQRNPAWRLLRADHAPLVLSFFGRYFIEENRGAMPATEVAAALDEELYSLNTDPAEPRFPRKPLDYLEDWAAPDAGWLRRFYPAASDEVHYEATPALEKAASVTSDKCRGSHTPRWSIGETSTATASRFSTGSELISLRPGRR